MPHGELKKSSYLWKPYEITELEKGVLIVIDENRSRIRLLPLNI